MIPGSCSAPVAPCCDCVYRTVRALVDCAANAVERCLGELCKGFERSVTIGEAVGPGDYVAGWIDTITPLQSPATRPGAKQIIASKQIAVGRIRLVGSGFPEINLTGAGHIALPSRKVIDYISEHFYGQAEAAWRALLNHKTPACSRGCEAIKIVNSIPSQPQTNWMAWTWPFQATLVL